MLEDLPDELIGEIIAYLPPEYKFIIRTKLTKPERKLLGIEMFHDVEWSTIDPQLQFDKKYMEQVLKTNCIYRDIDVFHYIFRSKEPVDIESYMKPYKFKMYSDVLDIAFQHNRTDVYEYLISKLDGVSNELLEKICKTNDVNLFKQVKNIQRNYIYKYCLEHESYSIIEYVEKNLSKYKV